MKQLPPIQSLQALEAVERLGSVQNAARFLAITASAVSHRLRALEAFVGTPLVAPRGRGLQLTARGHALVSELRPALAALADALAAPEEAIEGPLRIAAPPGFATSWLCPRIGDFRATRQNVDLTLSVGSDRDADVEVLFEEPPHPAQADFLVQPEFFPVCSPAFANASEGLRSLSALTGRTLLHLYDKDDWASWAAAAHSDLRTEAADSIVFEDVNLLLSAAISGQGIALGDAITCSDFLKSGALTRPFAATSKSRRAYFVRTNRDMTAARAFADWVKASLAS